jgi:hypothetical protein
MPEAPLAVKCSHCGRFFPSQYATFPPNPDCQVRGNIESCQFCGALNKTPDPEATDAALQQAWTPALSVRDFDYTHAFSWTDSHERIFATPEYPDITDTAMTFRRNVQRIISLSTLPLSLCFWATEMELARCQASYQVAKTLPDSVPDDVVKKCIALVNEILNDRMAESAKTKESLEHSKQQSITLFSTILSIQQLSRMPTALGVDAMLTSQLVGIWTAFETLAVDLWKASLNAHPKTLSHLQGTQKRIQRNCKGKDVDGVSSEPDKSLKLHAIHRLTEGTCDIRNAMGTLLQPLFPFQRLEGIRAAYSAAFSKKSEKVDGALSHECLDVLCHIRNLIVHRAGIVDARFVSDTLQYDAAPKVAAGHSLEVTGSVVVELANPVIECGVELISAVLDWLQEN